MSSYKKIYLNCPYKDKEECKKLGGQWDKDCKKWYITNDEDKTLFSKWIIETINEEAIEEETVYLDDEVEELNKNVIDIYEHVTNIYKIISNTEEEKHELEKKISARQQYEEELNSIKNNEEYNVDDWNKFYKIDAESMVFINLPDEVKIKLIN